MATVTQKAAECVKVVVRCRPLLPKETAKGYEKVVAMDVSRGVVALHNPKAKGRSDNPKREFTFDAVYGCNSKQVDLYDETFRPIVDAVLEGYNGTIFAYGQTGTGKTYTMEGVRSNPEERGVIPNSFEHVFTHIDRTENEKYLVRVSYLEIYQEEIRDLLSKDHKSRLELREKPDTGIYVKGLSSILTRNVKEIEGVMSLGNRNRSVGRTDMNEHSSRSHAIFIVTVECCAAGPDGNEHIRVGKLNLVDLAGSERQSKTGSTGERFKEATKINLSLSSLGNVISALVDGKSSHVPYRDSKLTRLLQDSLGGNAKTVMVANVGPADYNYDETLMTLRYANRAKNIKNKPHINEDPKDALLREYQEEIMRLKMALEKRKKGGGVKQKRRKVNAEGEVVSDDESEGEEGEGESRTEVTLKMKQAILEEEKQALLQNKELLDEEKQRLLSEMQKKADQLKKEQKKRDQLAEMIKKMEGKLLAGGKNIADRADDAKRAHEKMRQEMIEHKCREREIRQQLEAKEESTLEIKGTFTSLQEEVDAKTKRLNKLKSKLKAARAEIADYKEEQVSVREELALTIEELQRELKLRTQIVENFVPAEEVEKVTQRAFYDQDMDEWQLKPLKPPTSGEEVVPRPVSAIGNLRPISMYARIAASNGDPRYMAQNILKVELDMPNRTTRDYEGPLMAPTLQDALDAALQEEEEMVVDAFAFTSEDQPRVKGPRTRRHRKNPANHNSAEHGTLRTVPEEGETGEGGGGGARVLRGREPRSNSGSKSGQQMQQFPTSRGLVSRPVRFA